MRDPYERPGGAEECERRRRSRAPSGKLAKKLHPDANKHDKKAAAKFAELNAAYEIVGDEDKRKAFDRGEIDAEGKPRFQGFEGFGGGPGGRRRRLRPGRHFESFTWGPDGFQRARRRAAARGGFGGGGIEDILKDMFGGAAARRGRRRSRSSRRISAEPRHGPRRHRQR